MFKGGIVMKYEIRIKDKEPFTIKCKNKTEMVMKFKALFDYSDYEHIEIRGGKSCKKA